MNNGHLFYFYKSKSTVKFSKFVQLLKIILQKPKLLYNSLEKFKSFTNLSLKL